MGTYDQLMQLDQPPKKVRSATPQPRPAVEAVTSRSQPIPTDSRVETRLPLGARPSGKGSTLISRRHRDTTLPRHHATTVSRYRDTMLENVRVAVKQFGKEAATHRFTQQEKKAVAEIVYTYKGSGIRTSENEIARIGINFLVEDYKENGENSVLSRVLKALNS